MSDTERELLMVYGRRWNAEVKNRYMAPVTSLRPPRPEHLGLRQTTRPAAQVHYDYAKESARDKDVNPIAEEIIGQVNNCLLQWESPVKVQHGWRPDELVVRCKGVAGDYKALAKEMKERALNGENPARELLQWSQGPVALKNLDKHLAAFAVILYFAEVGRGYAGEIAMFENWLRESGQTEDAARAAESWENFPTDYSFAVIAELDKQHDFEPSDSDSDSSYIES